MALIEAVDETDDVALYWQEVAVDDCIGAVVRVIGGSFPPDLPPSGEVRNSQTSATVVRKPYGRDRSQSLEALKMRTQQIEWDDLAVPQFGVVKEALRQAHAHVEDVWAAIATAATAGDNRAFWLELGAIKPLSTAVDLLKLLRSTESIAFGPGMKEAIVSYGIALTGVQHLTWIQRAFLKRNRQALHNELRQLGHKTWKPIEVSDWLLLEIDSNIIIRDKQVNVAKAMIDSTLGNGVLQLNMGKGKTSCIIPMVAAVGHHGTWIVTIDLSSSDVHCLDRLVHKCSSLEGIALR
ncbi:hypothetical protein F5B22DRAFT_652468 [Xylaria bambusicola]|uniref:uncharacterized protein n=1 Tax=Xylaria bambusicola TaxID=326684 RepID=UPI0020073E2F|nr:uncharacterized protein F5B22DRAFT_652468 [Xylaria bambusicola]KAI0503066.1 hypothetical protein F5B22DRAFT_652468 [Xylaria bambusicola]